MDAMQYWPTCTRQCGYSCMLCVCTHCSDTHRVNESKLLVKLASYARWLVQAQPTSPTPSGSQTAKPTSAPTRTRGSSALARSERLASLQAVIGFLSALTNADADGRIIVQRAAKPTQQQQGPTQPPQTQVPQQQHKAQQQGRTAFGLVVSRGSDGSTTSSNGQEKQSETADRDREDDPTAERVRDDQGVMRASGGLKYVLLSAATHFGKVRDFTAINAPMQPKSQPCNAVYVSYWLYA